jgi:N-acetylglucosaminyldiphosphoundecaprenol N-acetyl-beta-D-mannosaminyltransferase
MSRGRRPFGLDFVARSEAEFAVDILGAPIPAGETARLVFTTNLNHVVDLLRSQPFREAYGRAWKITADGAPVVAYARFRGVALPGRLTGSGLFAELMVRLRPGHDRPFFVAANEQAATLCAKRLQARGLDPADIAWIVPPMGFETSDEFAADLAARIRSHGTTHLFLCVGAPKSEIWADQHRLQLGPCYVFCVGAALEFFVGLKSRGPQWVRNMGLEWLWRFSQEPRRLFNRYFVTSWMFLWCVARDLAGHDLVERS